MVWDDYFVIHRLMMINAINAMQTSNKIEIYQPFVFFCNWQNTNYESNV